MNKNLLYVVLVLFGLNGLHAFNPFTAMGNVIRGEASCQPSLVDKVAKGLPSYKNSRNKILSGQALKNKQAFEKDMALLHRCIGDEPNRDQQVLLGDKLKKNHPKLTEKVSSVCTQNLEFKKMFPNQCAIAGQAKAGIDRNKGIKTNPANAAGGGQRFKGKKGRRGGSRNPNGGAYNAQMMPPAPYGQTPAYGGYTPYADHMQQYQQPYQGMPMVPYGAPPAVYPGMMPPSYVPVDPMQQPYQGMPMVPYGAPPAVYPGMMPPPYAPVDPMQQQYQQGYPVPGMMPPPYGY